MGFFPFRKTPQERFQARQGDVFLVRVKRVPKNAIPKPNRNQEVVLARGEVTGHAHRIASPTAQLWDAGAKMYLTLREPAVLSHEEHKPVSLDRGVYQVIRQREYVPGPLRERRVED